MTRFRSDDSGVAERRVAGLRVAELRAPLRAMSAGKRARLVAASTAMLAGVLISAAAQAAPQVGYRVALTACPHGGITAPCLTINAADGTVYNITGATPKPPLNGRMIRLRATVSDKLSACLQGTVLDRIRWTPVRQKCAN
jgi:hypothetical protein